MKEKKRQEFDRISDQELESRLNLPDDQWIEVPPGIIDQEMEKVENKNVCECKDVEVSVDKVEEIAGTKLKHILSEADDLVNGESTDINYPDRKKDE